MNLWKQISAVALLIFLFYLKCSQVTAKSKTRILYYRNISYTFNPNHIENFNITFTHASQGIQINMTPAYNITKDVWVDMAVLIKTLNANKFQSIFKFKLNCCDLLKRSSGPGGFGIAKKWINNLLNSGSVAISCPVLKNNYSWSIFPRKKDGNPILQVEGFYLLLLNVYFKPSKGIEPLVNSRTLSEVEFT